MSTICITGAGSGIGKATAFALAKKGHTVLATTETESQAESLQSLVQEQSLESMVSIWKLDVTNPEDRETLRDKHIDGMIHNAGVAFTGSLLDVPVSIIKHNFEVNLFAILELNKIILPAMIARKSGRVIAISSIAGRVPLPFFAPYGMTKFALSTAMFDLRKELEAIESGVSVSVVEPGAYHTGFNQQMVNSRREFMSPESPFSASHEQRIEKDLKQFDLIEEKNLDSIVDAIVQASTVKNPRFRYSRPYIQAWGVRVLRMFGI